MVGVLKAILDGYLSLRRYPSSLTNTDTIRQELLSVSIANINQVNANSVGRK